MIVCCYSNVRLLVTGERIIETCSMLGNVFDPNSRIRRCVRGILPLSGNIRISIYAPVVPMDVLPATSDWTVT